MSNEPAPSAPQDPQEDAESPAPVAPPPPTAPRPRSLKEWLFADHASGGAPVLHHGYPWWKVMCLTGVDYFSTLGYQPGIAFVAAGLLSPVATAVLVFVTLFVALPIYNQVALRSPYGQGSLLMLEQLLPRWRGKATVLALLGFALTSFIVTITLSAADATAHIVENPLVPVWLHHRVSITTVLLLMLAAIFLKGFREAIDLAVWIVVVYLVLNAVVLTVAVGELWRRPELWMGWRAMVTASYGNPLHMLAAAALLFPKLALGLSGFETGVAVMPLVKGEKGDTHEAPVGRVRNTRKLLLAAALIMSVYLIGSSIVTTLLIPPAAFADGGDASGRALAYLAHLYLGHGFGTVYDLSTIFILWFAGASAMAGLLNLVPQFLPRYGMAPEWARATRPLVLVFTAISIVVTVLFRADVEAQAGAYATGVLAFMTSAALAVAIALWETPRRWVYGTMALVFVYTTAANIVERPEGIKIASFFVATIVCTSLASRALRATELRIGRVVLAESAKALVDEVSASDDVRIVAHRPDKRSIEEYDRKERQARDDHSLDSGEPILFLEVTQGDASHFTGDLDVRGIMVGRHRILRCKSPAIPNAIAALLLYLRDETHRIPHAYFGWTEGNPITYVLKYLTLGEGDTAPVTREILRRAIKNPLDRPRIHVG
jgi:hypothetical protein